MVSLRTWWLNIFSSPAEFRTAQFCYIACVSQARNPFFYTRANVPDTLDGRFEMVVLHTALLLAAAEHAGASQKFLQTLMECFIDDMDRNVRELGVGDTGVGKRVKAMAYAMNGRQLSYRACGENAASWQAALGKNVYRTLEMVPAEGLTVLTNYAVEAEHALRALTLDSLTHAQIPWPVL